MKESFIVQYRLKMQPYQKNILNKRFEIGRKIYNALVHITLNRYQEMKKRKDYRKALEERDFKTVNKIRQEFGFNEYSFHSLVKQMQQHFKCHIDSNTAQKIAKQISGRRTRRYFMAMARKSTSKNMVHSTALKARATKVESALKIIILNG